MQLSELRTFKQAVRHISSAPHYYALFGLHTEFTREELSAARIALALLVHPDRNPGAAAAQAHAAMAHVNAALAVLASPARRVQYMATVFGSAPQCSACKGRGYTARQRGYTSRTTTVCSACAGSGRQPYARSVK